MKQEKHLWDRWLEEATRGLRSHPDYDQVRQELTDHLEDRTEGLRHSFPSLPREEAERMALNSMGEAKELSPILAKAHSQVLGALYDLGGLLLVLAVPLVALEGIFMLWARILPLVIPGWPF